MPTPIPTTQHPTLKQLIDETYTDKVEEILNARLEDDGAIIALARDEDRIVAFKYTDEQVSVKILNPEVIEGAEDDEPEPEEINQGNRVDADPFTPDPSNDEFKNLATLLSRFTWDEIRDIATEQDWVWDEDAGRFVDGSGEVVSHQKILDATQDELARLESEIEEATQLLAEGAATVPEWEELIAEITVSAGLLFLLFGLAGRRPDEITDSIARTHLSRQFEFLRSFAKSVASGQMTLNGIAARAKLYVHDAQLLYNLAQDFIHPVDTWAYAANVLGSCNHCQDCVSETEKGWTQRSDMSMPGSRICKWRCCCQLRYSKDKTERLDATILSVKSGWL